MNKSQLETKVSDLETEIARLKSNVTHSVHLIEGIEYERGWGQRPDGYVAFKTEEAARLFIVNYDKQHNNLFYAPDEYTKYTYIGVRQCTHAFLNAFSGKLGYKHFDRISELNT